MSNESNTVGTGRIRIAREDITLVELDAFVFYAQPDLNLGTGFGNAIAVRGGPAVQQELDALGPQDVCAAVLTGSGKLKAKHIIHAVGPRFQEEDTEAKLRKTIVNALKLAEEKGFERVAFPAMGRGFYGIPLLDSARITVGTIKDHLATSPKIREVVICVNDHAEVDAFQAQL